jgi:4-aminobutyrate aminotransferase-like enzyme/Ser/Thr protein kinase RdoA (MazF antagonist)
MSLLPFPSEHALVQPAPPELTAEDAAGIARELFGVEAAARSLGSHQDRNFLLEGAGEPLLLKVANPATTAAELEAQSLAADRVAELAPSVRAPRSRRDDGGASTSTGTGTGTGTGTVRSFEFDGQTLNARLLDFLDGAPLSGGDYISATAVRAIGRLAADVDAALDGLEAPGIERPHQWDLRRAPAVLDALLPHVADPELRRRLRRAADAAWSIVERHAAALRVQVIHGDLTDDNVVWSDPVTRVPDGVIDFGDLNRSWTVGEVAITISSLLHHDGVDLRAALRCLGAYHEVRPLSRAEAESLWPLVVLRGAILVASGHHVVATDADNAYASGNLHHDLAVFDAATRMPLPVATALVLSTIGEAVDELRLPAHVPLIPALATGDIAMLDYSATSPGLHEGRWLDPGAESELAAEALSRGARAAITRFAEPRLTRSTLLSHVEPENVVLGVDVALGASVELVAPWAGEVEVTTDGLVLRGDGLVLALDGAETLVETETPVVAGQPIGRAETTLSLRVRRDGTDAPALTIPSIASAWRAVVADPTPLLTGAAAPTTGADPDSAALIARRRDAFADAQEVYYAEPPTIVRGWKEHLIGADGRVHLDAVNNVSSIGHAHPRLVAAATEQWKLLNTNSRFNYPAVVEFSERLGALLPDGLDAVFLVNSGSEAVDLALRIARAATERQDVLAVREAYHGWTGLADAVSTSIADNPAALETRPDWVHTVEAPNTYRGRYRGEASARYAHDAVAEVERLAAAGSPVGAFIAEAYYGNAGGMALPDGYLEAVYAAVRAHGGLAVADEVQVGYGRLGEWFWGFEQQGVVPDIVTVAKAVGNGHPLGAVITTREIAERFRSQGSFFSSAGGSPVSSVVGLTVLDVIRDERLQENARDVGAYFRHRMSELGARHPLIGAVHGSGLYLGLELVRDRDTLEPAPEETTAICERMREFGVIVQPTGDRRCVLKIKPPLCFTRESADAFVDALDRVLTTGW